MANEDLHYQAWLRRQPCARCGKRCTVSVHHHTGRRGLGQRASDESAMPLCPACHMGLHDNNGPFKGWTREQLRAWQDEQCTQHRARYRPPENDECETKETTTF